MDFSKFKTPDWLMIGGGAAMLILGFTLDWTTVDTGFGSASGDGPFDYFFTGGLAWILVIAVGALAAANAAGKLPPNQPWPLILLACAGLATILMLLRIILGARFDFADRGIGMYGAFVFAAVALAGAYLSFQAAGGDIKDLTDVDKLKASFSKDDAAGGDDPPPPPPSPPAPPSPQEPPAPPAPPTPPAD